MCNTISKLGLMVLVIVLTPFAVYALDDSEQNSTNSTNSTKSMVPWGSAEGIRRLEQSQFKVDFFKLANHFESQSNKIFCGPTSAAIVLNALRIRQGKIEIPQDTSLLTMEDRRHLPAGEWSPFYQRYTQNNVFFKSPKSRQLVLGKPQVDTEGKSVKDVGFQLRQFGELLGAHGLAVTLRVVDDGLANAEIKNEMIANLKTAHDYVIVNYRRTVLKQKGGGHISPLGAYHQASDSFLILDVTPNKADWVWVKSGLLIAAMRTFDTLENRGYVLVKN